MSVSKELLDTLIRLEPAKEPNESLRKLLRRKVLSDIRKYEVMSTTFQKKYNTDFNTFRQSLPQGDWEVERIILTGNWLKPGWGNYVVNWPG